jgi:peptidoglycan hydrolase-like protein with peptidoglycan-binding domain
MNSGQRPASKMGIPMNRKLLVTALLFLAALSTAWADPAVESAQAKLKDGGFYYGEINGKKDADTTAAIRRYQIRNGLQITGELNAETQRALGLTSKPATAPATRPAATPATRPAQTPGPTPPGFLEETPAPTPTPAPRPAPREESELDDAPEPPPQPRVESAGVFAETPYEGAPPQTQQEIISRAQLILMRQGFYRDEIDGLYGPAMNFALRNYQARFGLRPSGRLDVETLAALSLLPEQQRTNGYRRSHRPFFLPRIRIGPGQERVYIPR